MAGPFDIHVGNESSDILELLAKSRQGDEQASWEATNHYIGLYEGELWGYVRKLCRRQDLDISCADDIWDGTRIRLHKRFLQKKEFKEGIVKKGYLFMIAHNVAVDLRRGKNKELHFDPIDSPLVQVILDDGKGPAEIVMHRMDRTDERTVKELKTALSKLPKELREVVILREYDGRKYEEICAMLKISPGTAHGRFQKAIEILRETKTLREMVEE